MLAGIDFNFERTSLGSRVAVRDDPSHARPAHCFAGADGEHEERHRQDQDPLRARRVFQMGWLGTSRCRRRMASTFLVAAVVLVVRLTMLLATTTPRLPKRMVTCFCEFDGA